MVSVETSKYSRVREVKKFASLDVREQPLPSYVEHEVFSYADDENAFRKVSNRLLTRLFSFISSILNYSTSIWLPTVRERFMVDDDGNYSTSAVVYTITINGPNSFIHGEWRRLNSVLRAKNSEI